MLARLGPKEEVLYDLFCDNSSPISGKGAIVSYREVGALPPCQVVNPHQSR